MGPFRPLLCGLAEELAAHSDGGREVWSLRVGVRGATGVGGARPCCGRVFRFESRRRQRPQQCVKYWHDAADHAGSGGEGRRSGESASV